MADRTMIGKVGHVTGTVGTGMTGEVMVPVRGGTEAFIAYPESPDDRIPENTPVMVVDFLPPRTVTVTRLT